MSGYGDGERERELVEESLAAEDRDALTQHFAWGYVPDAVLTEFEQIVAARVAEARAEEQTAQEFEAVTARSAWRVAEARAEAAEAERDNWKETAHRTRLWATDELAKADARDDSARARLANVEAAVRPTDHEPTNRVWHEQMQRIRAALSATEGGE